MFLCITNSFTVAKGFILPAVCLQSGSQPAQKTSKKTIWTFSCTSPILLCHVGLTLSGWLGRHSPLWWLFIVPCLSEFHLMKFHKDRNKIWDCNLMCKYLLKTASNGLNPIEIGFDLTRLQCNHHVSATKHTLEVKSSLPVCFKGWSFPG